METSVLTVEKRMCKECGDPVGPGRADKEFCCGPCKTSFNNRRRKEQELAEAAQLSVPDYITRIQEIQLKNRLILSALCTEDDPGRIKMRDLLGKGFNPKFFTSEEPTKTGNLYRFCFEYGYWLDGDYAVVVHREREVL
jgi:hypothetical protein